MRAHSSCTGVGKMHMVSTYHRKIVVSRKCACSPTPLPPHRRHHLRRQAPVSFQTTGAQTPARLTRAGEILRPRACDSELYLIRTGVSPGAKYVSLHVGFSLSAMQREHNIFSECISLFHCRSRVPRYVNVGYIQSTCSRCMTLWIFSSWVACYCFEWKPNW